MKLFSLLMCSLWSLLASASSSPAPSLANASSDNFRVSFTEHGLNEVLSLGSTLLFDALKNGLTLPDIHLDEHVAEPIGHITLDLTDIQLTQFTQVPSASAALSAPASAALSVSDIQFQVSCGYKWRKVHAPHASDHGTLTADPSGVAFSTTLNFAVLPNGTATVSESGTATSIASFTLHFDGKVAWLYNLLTSLFSSSIKTAIASAIEKEIDSVVDGKLNAALAKIPAAVHVGGGLSELGIGIFLSDIQVGSAPLEYFAISDTSTFTDNKTAEVCPHAPTSALPFVVDDPQDAMMQLLISDNCFNCYFWVVSRNGALNFTVPAGNTSTWALLIPQLNKLYPGQQVSLDISPELEPDLHCTEQDGLVGTVVLRAKSSVVDPDSGNKTYTHTLRLAVGMSFDIYVGNQTSRTSSDSGSGSGSGSGSVSLSDAYPSNAVAALVGNVTALKFNATVEDSAIGDISALGLKALAAIAGPLLKNSVDAVLNLGIPIPDLGPVDISSSRISTLHDGYFVLSGNFSFNTTGA